MQIHEHQAKSIFQEYGILVPEGKVVRNKEEAFTVAQSIGGKVMVKAQIHSGGRGKAGGVKLADNPTNAAIFTSEMIGERLLTNQTGYSGLPVNKVLIEKVTDIQSELYFDLHSSCI